MKLNLNQVFKKSLRIICKRQETKIASRFSYMSRSIRNALYNFFTLKYFGVALKISQQLAIVTKNKRGDSKIGGPNLR